MDIRRVDPDDESMEVLNAISTESHEFENPYPTPFTLDEHREELRNKESSIRSEGYLGYDGETPVVAGHVELFLSDNTDKAFVIVDVVPSLRRRGFGSQMTDFVLDRARAEGRSTLITVVHYPFTADESHPDRTFAVNRGFAFSQADLHRVLKLPVAPAAYERLAAEAADHHKAYTLVDFVGLAPEEMREGYCVLLNQIITDAPSGDIDFDEGRLTPEHLIEREAVFQAQGRTTYTTVALDAEGTPIAHNLLVVPKHDPDKIFNFDTMVLRAHRGHRLGIATKVRNLQRVAALHPERTTVHTWNAESNGPMIAVNDAMGFEPVSYLGEYVRTLT